MLKTFLAATAALTLMSGIAAAQTIYSGSTTESTQMVAPASRDVDVTATTRRTAGRNGVMIEKDESGTEVSRPADIQHSQSSTETTTTR